MRLELADLVNGRLPPWTTITGINNRGDPVGIGSDRFFGLDHPFVSECVGSPADRISGSAANEKGATPAPRLPAGGVGGQVLDGSRASVRNEAPNASSV